MNKNNKFSLPTDWVQRKLTLLQRELETSGKWPEPANQLWLDLIQSKQVTDKEADDDMFSIVVSDALDGLDISKLHPGYYRRMLQNPKLFQSFLDVIEILEADEEGALEPIETSPMALPDLVPVSPEPIYERPTVGGWSVIWRQTVGQLNTIFSNLGPNLAFNFRSSQGLLEESAAPLIRSEVMIEERHLGVRLSAVLADDPDALNLRLTVALLDDETADFPLTSLKAGIQWGDYHQVETINSIGQASFPPVSINMITDETGETINNDLQLLIQPDS